MLRMTESNRPVRRKKLIIPDFEDDKEELLRLMKRIRPTVEKNKEYLYREGCAVCSEDHVPEECPCLDRILPDTVLGPLFDSVCNCCGKIGHLCCPKGAYAILIRCDGCGGKGHWYWENRCPKDWCRPSCVVEIPSIQDLEHEVMQNKNKAVLKEDDQSASEDENDVLNEDDQSASEDENDYDNFYDNKRRLKRLKVPDFEDDKEELLRLMKRIRPTVEKKKEYLYKEGCAVCSKDHFPEDCPCLDRIPPGTLPGPLFDSVCNCCGRIGDFCCIKGSYAILVRCDGCGNKGHWYWENMCPKDWCRPSCVIEIPSIEDLEHEVVKNKSKDVVKEYCDNFIKNMEEDEDLCSQLQTETAQQWAKLDISQGSQDSRQFCRLSDFWRKFLRQADA